MRTPGHRSGYSEQGDDQIMGWVPAAMMGENDRMSWTSKDAAESACPGSSWSSRDWLENPTLEPEVPVQMHICEVPRPAWEYMDLHTWNKSRRIRIKRSRQEASRQPRHQRADSFMSAHSNQQTIVNDEMDGSPQALEAT